MFQTTLLDSHPLNNLTVRVGSASEFVPRFELSRWSGHARLSARLLGFGATIAATDQIGPLWAGQGFSARSVQITQSGLNPQGAHEFDLTLYQKPSSNKIRFALEHSGNLEFIYQPVLPKGGRRTQPERANGSYAVYLKETPATYVDGTVYGCGKICHIFRPLMFDSNDRAVWGEINIDRDILTVTIPQEFLDTAVYPIRHAAGLEFGYHTIGAGGDSNDSSTFTYSKAVGTPASDGTLTAIIGYGNDGGSVPSTISAALYSTTGSAPNSLLGANDTGVTNQNSISPPFTDWVSVPVTASVVTGTQYWLGWRAPTGTFSINADTGSSGDLQGAGGGPANWPSTASGLSSFNPRYSIYATYDASAPAGPVVLSMNPKRLKPHPFSPGRSL